MNGLFNQQVTIANRTGLDGYGRAQYGAASTYFARVQLADRRRLMPNGEVELTNGKIFLDPDVSVDNDSIITYSGKTYRVFSVDDATGGSGRTHHLTVEIQLWPTA